MFGSAREIQESLLRAGLSPGNARRVARSARPTVLIATEAVEREEEIPLGATKIGGCPDLPASMAWPMRPPYPNGAALREEHLAAAEEFLKKDRMDPDHRERVRRWLLHLADAVTREAPLAFVAQIDLAAIAAAGAVDPDLPWEGRLLLFYDVEEGPWGFRTEDFVGTRLIYDQTPVSALVRMPAPAEITGTRLKPLRCTLAAGVVWERISLVREHTSSDIFDDPDEVRRMEQWEADSGRDWHGTHCVGGYPGQIRDDMAGSCVLLSHGMGEGGLSEGPPGIDLERERQDWVFLFQIASDENNGMIWGDCGTLYLWIHRDDLRARRFEKARLILQCD